jgi:hypothetical protein
LSAPRPVPPWRLHPSRPSLSPGCSSFEDGSRQSRRGSDKSASRSSAVLVTLSGVVRASLSPSLSFFGMMYTRICTRSTSVME